MNPNRQFAKSIREFMKERQSLDRGETVVNEVAKPSQVRSAISREKKKLMKKWAQRGGYENFGQKEVRALEKKFKPDPFGSPEERQIATMIQDFDNWAMNYTGDMKERQSIECGETVVNEARLPIRMKFEDYVTNDLRIGDVFYVKGGGRDLNEKPYHYKVASEVRNGRIALEELVAGTDELVYPNREIATLYKVKNLMGKEIVLVRRLGESVEKVDKFIESRYSTQQVRDYENR